MFRDNNDPTVYFQLGLFLSLAWKHLYFSVGELVTINSAGEGYEKRDEQLEAKRKSKLYEDLYILKGHMTIVASEML